MDCQVTGRTWRARASGALSANGAEQDEQSRGVMLLGDILRVFDGRLKKGGKAADRVS